MTVPDKPLLLLDVDGVINAFPFSPVDPWGERWCRCTVNGYRITTAPQCLEALRRIHHDGTAEVRWLTTWEDCDWYRDLAQHLDLPDWPVHCRRVDHDQDHGWWKLAGVQALDDGRRRMVWLDDELPSRQVARRWLTRQGARVLGIGPDEMTGLTPAHFATIADFLASPGPACSQETSPETPSVGSR